MKEKTKNILLYYVCEPLMCIFLGFALGGMFCFLYGIVDKDGFGIFGIILGSIIFCVSSIFELILARIFFGKKEFKNKVIDYVLIFLILAMIFITFNGIEHTLWLSIIFGALGLCCFTFLLFFRKKLFKKRRRRKKKTVKKVGSSEKDDSMENVDSSEKIDFMEKAELMENIDSMEKAETLEPKDVS